MPNFVNMTLLDLTTATMFLHFVKPDTKDKIVYGVEMPQPGDQSMVFHMVDKDKIGLPNQNEDMSMVILACDFISEHSFWKDRK